VRVCYGVRLVAELVVAEGLVGRGRARRLLRCSIGPRDHDTRRVVVEWEDPAIYTMKSRWMSARAGSRGEWHLHTSSNTST
jgi:hypothetical protein